MPECGKRDHSLSFLFLKINSAVAAAAEVEEGRWEGLCLQLKDNVEGERTLNRG